MATLFGPTVTICVSKYEKLVRESTYLWMILKTAGDSGYPPSDVVLGVKELLSGDAAKDASSQEGKEEAAC